MMHSFSPRRKYSAPISLAALAPIFLVCATGCTPSPPQYEEGRDTVQSFGNGRFQVCEGSPQSYMLFDEAHSRGAVAHSVVSWKQQGQFAYIIATKPQCFYLIDIPTGRLSHYPQLAQVPPAHRAIFKAMFGKKQPKSK